MKKHLFALSMAALSLPAAADFTPHSYTYIEGGWFDRSAEWKLDIGEEDDKLESDGYSVAGSFRTEGGVLFQAHYGSGDIDKAWGIDLSDTDIDMEVESFGFLIGGANQVDAKTSVWGGFGYGRDAIEASEAGVGSTDYDVNMYSIGGGVRYTLVKMIEVGAGLRVIHFRADETDLLDEYRDTDGELSASVRFQPLDMLSIGASYARQLDAESDIVKADIRFQF